MTALETNQPFTRGVVPLRVLCVDDHEAVAEMLKCALELAGHDVACVGDGLAALERIAADDQRFDVVLTDHCMPRLTGLQLVERLRAGRFAGRIVVHCSCLLPRDAAAYRRLGVDCILDKPAAQADLLAAISAKWG